MLPNATASLRFSSMPSSPIFFIQLRSAPAQNTLPRPASTTARTAGSASSSPEAAFSSAIMASLNALRTSGRLSQRTATPWPICISMVLWFIFPTPFLHPENAEAAFLDRRVERGGDREREDVARFLRGDQAVVPEPRGRVVRVPLALVLLAERALEVF